MLRTALSILWMIFCVSTVISVF